MSTQGCSIRTAKSLVPGLAFSIWMMLRGSAVVEVDAIEVELVVVPDGAAAERPDRARAANATPPPAAASPPTASAPPISHRRRWSTVGGIGPTRHGWRPASSARPSRTRARHPRLPSTAVLARRTTGPEAFRVARDRPQVMPAPRSPRCPAVGCRVSLSRTRTHLAAAVVAVSVPLVAATINALRSPWRPTGDFGLIALQTMDVPGDLPLYGVYSRFGFHHPGPALFLVYSLPSRLLGPSGLLVAAALVNLAAVVAAVALFQRRGGTTLLVLGALGVVTLELAAAAQLADPWNAWVPMFPFVVAILLAWSVWERDWWALPALVVVLSFIVQAHLGYLALAGWLAVVAAGRGAPLVGPSPGSTSQLDRPIGRALRGARVVGRPRPRRLGAPPVGPRDRGPGQPAGDRRALPAQHRADRRRRRLAAAARSGARLVPSGARGPRADPGLHRVDRGPVAPGGAALPPVPRRCRAPGR